MTPSGQLLRDYRSGRETATGVVLTVLAMPRGLPLHLTLEDLPKELVEALRDFLAYYGPHTGIIRGPIPRPATVTYVRGWLEHRRRKTRPRPKPGAPSATKTTA